MNCTGKETSLEHCVKGKWGRPVRSCKPAYVLCYQNSMYTALLPITAHAPISASQFGDLQFNKHTFTFAFWFM